PNRRAYGKRETSLFLQPSHRARLAIAQAYCHHALTARKGADLPVIARAQHAPRWLFGASWRLTPSSPGGHRCASVGTSVAASSPPLPPPPCSPAPPRRTRRFR